MKIAGKGNSVAAFETEKTVQYWLNGAIYDLETGQTLLRSKKYPYALFFGHLALEKILKATVVKRTGEHAPYSHSLVMLAQRAGLDVPEEMLDRLAWRVDARLHPVPLSSSAFSEDTWVPLIHEVRSTGIEIH